MNALHRGGWLHRLLSHRDAPLAVVIFIGAVARLAMSLGTYGILWPDSFRYYLPALQLAQGNFLFFHAPYHTPGYIAFLATFLALGEIPAAGAAIILAQRLLGLLTVVIVWHIALRLFDRTVAFLAALAFALHYLQLYYETVVQTEVLFTFLLAGLMLAALAALDRPAPGRYLLTGFLAGLVTLTRPVGKYQVILILLALGISLRRPRRIAVAVALVLLPYLLAILPWMLINHRTLGFWGVSKGQGMNLMLRALDIDKLEPAAISHYPRMKDLYLAERFFTNRPSYILFEKLSREPGVGPILADDTMFGFGLETVREHPWRYAAACLGQFEIILLRAYDSVEVCGSRWGPYLCGPTSGLSLPAFPEAFRRDHHLLRGWIVQFMLRGRIWMPGLVLLALAGMASCLTGDRNRRIAGLLLILTIVYLAAVPAVFNIGQDRYRLPFDPYLFIFAGAGTKLLWRALRGLRRRGTVSAPPG